MGTLGAIRRKVRANQYEITDHARTEMQDDGLRVADLEHAILFGKIAQTLTDDLRGTRYVIWEHKRNVAVVCCILPSGLLRIITDWAGGPDEE